MAISRAELPLFDLSSPDIASRNWEAAVRHRRHSSQQMIHQDTTLQSKYTTLAVKSVSSCSLSVPIHSRLLFTRAANTAHQKRINSRELGGLHEGSTLHIRGDVIRNDSGQHSLDIPRRI